MQTIYAICLFSWIIGPFLMVICEATSMSFLLKPMEDLCLLEYFPDKTLVIYDIDSNITDVHFSIESPENEMLAKGSAEHFKHALTTYSGGYYELCSRNKNQTYSAMINFSLKSGVSAKDYSSVAKSKDLKPIDMDLEKLEDQSKELIRFATYAIVHESLFEYSLNNISNKIVIFSGIVITVMVVIGLLETYYLKKYMERRKII